MRKISKALLYPPGGDRLDARPRGISGATITSWDGPPVADLEALFAKPRDQLSVTGADSQPISSAGWVSIERSKVELVTFTTPERFLTVAIV